MIRRKMENISRKDHVPNETVLQSWRKTAFNKYNFVVNRLFMKLFKTSNIDTVNYCRTEFQFELPCIVLGQRCRKSLAKYRSCENVFCKFV